MENHPHWVILHACMVATAAAKSLQSCPTLCDPIDGSLPGSAVPGILQAKTLEWVAISFSNAMHAWYLMPFHNLCINSSVVSRCLLLQPGLFLMVTFPIHSWDLSCPVNSCLSPAASAHSPERQSRDTFPNQGHLYRTHEPGWAVGGKGESLDLGSRWGGQCGCF